MAEVIAFPARGDVFFDLRCDDRTLRVSWHPELKLVVLSLWRDGRCSATFRMPADDVPQLVSTLVEGLAECIPPSISAPRPGPKQKVAAEPISPVAPPEPLTDPGPRRMRNCDDATTDITRPTGAAILSGRQR
jgi:hypothetical protein